jgi:hypothetical protein
MRIGRTLPAVPADPAPADPAAPERRRRQVVAGACPLVRTDGAKVTVAVMGAVVPEAPAAADRPARPTTAAGGRCPPGEKISAEEVENLIYRLPGVARVAAVAKADPDPGERVCAVVVVEPGTHLTLASVRAALTAMQVARYKLPEGLLVVEELPLTKVGKIDKKRPRDVVRGKADSVEVV